jgi:hypothetical protein
MQIVFTSIFYFTIQNILQYDRFIGKVYVRTKTILVQTHSVKFNGESLGSSTDETSTLTKYCA